MGTQTGSYRNHQTRSYQGIIETVVDNTVSCQKNIRIPQ